MDVQTLRKSLSQSAPPAGLSLYLQSLWYDAKGDWQQAHDLIQDLPDTGASWIHAYLHRKEGDQWNADYWYRKAGRKRPSSTLEEEWEELARNLG